MLLLNSNSYLRLFIQKMRSLLMRRSF